MNALGMRCGCFRWTRLNAGSSREPSGSNCRPHVQPNCSSLEKVHDDEQ